MIAKRAALLAALWAAGILVLTLMPQSDVPAWPWAEQVHLDKIVHAVLFGVQGALLGLVLAGGRPWRTLQWPLLWAFLAATLYGGLVELLQEAMGQGRHGDVLDLLADGAGALLGVVLLAWWRRRH